MAIPRPTFIDLGDSRTTSQLSIRWNADHDSPRVQHFDGDVPPALSPLDAFAAHSRKLARELEETRKAGERRLSRLPPQHITRSLGEHKENRPSVFRQLSGENDSVPPLPQFPKHDGGNLPEYNEPKNRPKSSYPRFSGVLDDEEDKENEVFTTPMSIQRRSGYFDVPRTQSPPPLEKHSQESSPKKHISCDSFPQPTTPSNPDLTFTLAP